MKVILPNRPFKMDETINEINVKKLLARINNLSDINNVEIKKFVKLEFYVEPLYEVEYTIFGREERLEYAKAS